MRFQSGKLLCVIEKEKAVGGTKNEKAKFPI